MSPEHRGGYHGDPADGNVGAWPAAMCLGHAGIGSDATVCSDWPHTRCAGVKTAQAEPQRPLRRATTNHLRDSQTVFPHSLSPPPLSLSLSLFWSLSLSVFLSHTHTYTHIGKQAYAQTDAQTY